MTDTKDEEVDRLAELLYVKFKDEMGPLFRAAVQALPAAPDPTDSAWMGEVFAGSVLRAVLIVLMEQMVVRGFSVDNMTAVVEEILAEMREQDAYIQSAHGEEKPN